MAEEEDWEVDLLTGSLDVCALDEEHSGPECIDDSDYKEGIWTAELLQPEAELIQPITPVRPSFLSQFATASTTATPFSGVDGSFPYTFSEINCKQHENTQELVSKILASARLAGASDGTTPLPPHGMTQGFRANKNRN